MKTQVARNWRLGRTELQVTTQRGETLDIAGADWLRALGSKLLLPVDYDPEKARNKKLELAYDITGLTSLKRRIGRVWSQEGYYTILEGIERVCVECAGGTRLIERILFDIDHVYLNEHDEPRFIYVPLDGVAYDASTNSPLLVLGALASRRLRFDSVACTANAEHLRQFVLTKEVFSLNVYRNFLDAEFADLRRAAQEIEAAADAERKAAHEARQMAYLDSLFANFDTNKDT
jgi:hypothetical protein